MKRYKQAILSNFFVTTDDEGIHHLVEANLDIESRGDRTLCTEVLQGERQYEVLTNHHLHDVCMICAAILDRRISNMPKERKVQGAKSGTEIIIPEAQLCLTALEEDGHPANNGHSSSFNEQSGQFELFF